MHIAFWIPKATDLVCNIYCLSTATMVLRERHSVTSYVHYLCCVWYVPVLKLHIVAPSLCKSHPDVTALSRDCTTSRLFDNYWNVALLDGQDYWRYVKHQISIHFIYLQYVTIVITLHEGSLESVRSFTGNTFFCCKKYKIFCEVKDNSKLISETF
jgi:hypothetical protein